MGNPSGLESASRAEPIEKKTTFWGDLRESLSGSDQDYTEGNIARAITLLAVPMVLEMSMESVFAVVDVFFVAQLGSGAVAAVGLTESLLTLVFAIAMGLSMATTAMVARRIGEKDVEGASVASAQALWIGIAVSILVGGAGILFGPQLLGLMGASPNVIGMGSGYTTVMLGSSFTIFLLFLINAIFRGAGDAAIAMRVLWLSNLINIILDPCLIFGWGPFPEMGVTGAAVATSIGRGIGVAYQLLLLFGPQGRVRLGLRHMRADWPVLNQLLRVSGPGMLQFLIATASWLGLVRIIAIFGSGALAGYTIALRIIVFAILPSWGMANAAATLVGQNLGAGKPDRAESSVWATGLYNTLFLSGVGLLFIAFAEPLIRIFTSDPEVVAYGVRCLRLVSLGYPAYAYGMVMVQAFNGAGDTTTPSVINFFCYWMLQIPMAYVLAVPGGAGPDGAFWAITIAESVLAVAGVLMFRRGTWKQRRI